MGATPATQAGAASSSSGLTPTGKLGFRGRAATPEERARILDAYFFEGARRTPYLIQFFVLMLLSALIAAFGLANNSAAVIIGAMLVAPLMTPILAIAAAVVQGWGRRMIASLTLVAAGAACAIAVGILVSIFAQYLRTGLPLPSELLARTNPNMIDLGIALAAGAAGGFVAVRSEASGALPGVGIAVALVPPLATVGMTVGLGEWNLAFGAFLLFLTNLVAIVLSAGLVFTAAGFAADLTALNRREASTAAVVVIVGVLLVGIPLSIHSAQRLAEADSVARTLQDVQEWAPELTITQVDIDHSVDPIQVRVSAAGVDAPPDVSTLARQIADDLGSAVDVGIVFVPRLSGTAPAP